MIPIVDLKRQYHALKPDIDRAVARVLENAHFILGPEVAALETEFAAYCGAQHAAGVNSGTSALHLALLAAGVGPDTEVVTVPFTFVATAAAVRYTGARPVFVDIDPETLTIDPARIEQAITPRTRAILPVHLFGQCADMDPILEIARRRGIAVIEDAAQAHGAEYKGRRAGSLADIACFSFYPGKNLGAFGEGGMVVTSDPAHALTVRTMRDWGQSRRYYHDIIGFNYRLEGIQGAILRVKLPHLDAWNETRRRTAALYAELFAGSPVRTPVEKPYGRHVFHCFVIRTPARDRLHGHLTSLGIQTSIHYPVPIHLQPAYADLGYRAGDFPVSEAASREVLSIPIHGLITEDEVRTVAAAIRDFVSHSAAV